MVQKVRKCPKCSGFFLLWTDVCLRCGRVDVAQKPATNDAVNVMDVRVVQVVEGNDGMSTARPTSGRHRLPEGNLPVDDMFDVGPDKPRAEPVAPPAPEAPPRHFLVLGYRDVIELVPGKAMTLGRDPRSTLRVDRPDIARHHATLDWTPDPPRPFIRDAGSSATFVNGEPATGDADQGTLLEDGDEIALGTSFKMAYRFASSLEFGTPRARPEPAAPAPPLAEGSPPPRAVAERPKGESGRFVLPPPATLAAGEKADVAPEGDLSRTSTYAVLAHLEARGFSGVLRVFTEGGDSGMILLEQGKPKTVIFGSLTGKDAVSKLATLTTGTYRFHGA